MSQAGRWSARSAYADWVLACAAAEAIGMTAAATAARLGEDRPAALALTLVVAGGLVEGVALGVLQARALGRRWPWLRRGRYLTATVVVAGLGWAGASAPGVLAGSDGGDESPPLLLVIPAAAALGLAMGALLGAAQALALRGVVPHPWRWVGASAAAWPGAMALIFLGATTPDADWPTGSVVALGTLTGAAAGAALGAVSGRFLPFLARTDAVERTRVTS